MQCLPGCEDALAGVDWQPVLEHAADLMRDHRSVTWFPDYGAALLAIGNIAAPGGTVIQRTISIIGLDNWEFDPHWMNPPRCLYKDVQFDMKGFTLSLQIARMRIMVVACTADCLEVRVPLGC